jgi:hypothetical protein
MCIGDQYTVLIASDCRDEWNSTAKIEVEFTLASRGLPPVFMEVRILKDLKSIRMNTYGSVDSKGVTDSYCVRLRTG